MMFSFHRLANATALVLIALPAFAQNAGVVVQAKAELMAEGKNLSGACGAILITNLVAQRTHMGLLRKIGGNRAALLPDGSCLPGEQTNQPGYATDYLIDRVTFFGTDILADGGGANGPQWSAPETDAAMVARNRVNFSEPVYFPPPVVVVVPPVAPPAPPTVEPPAPPVVVPTPVVTPAPLPSTELAYVAVQLAELKAQIAAVKQDIADFREAVRSKWAAFVTSPVVKYGLAIAAGILAKWKL